MQEWRQHPHQTNIWSGWLDTYNSTLTSVRIDGDKIGVTLDSDRDLGITLTNQGKPKQTKSNTAFYFLPESTTRIISTSSITLLKESMESTFSLLFSLAQVVDQRS